jgi:hypothetical protein
VPPSPFASAPIFNVMVEVLFVTSVVVVNSTASTMVPSSALVT